jgi:hypothetical protein
MADATLTQVKEFFGCYPNLSAFAVDWKQMNDTDKAQLKAGIGDGSLAY